MVGNNLLLDDKPILVLPTLAKIVGLNESIVLQQMHYWLKDSKNIRENYKWIYNTYEEWQKQFPFWSVSTIRRTIAKLESQNLIISGNFNRLAIDNTKWYRINYPLLQSMNRPSVQNEQTACSKWTDGQVNLNRPIPEITTETTTKITSNKYIVEQAQLCIPFKEIIDYLNQQASTRYRHTTKATQSHIRARWNEGYTDIEDYKTVIDNKVDDWLNTDFEKHLAPSTLFGTKFEKYLNQRKKSKKGIKNNEKHERLNEQLKQEAEYLGF